MVVVTSLLVLTLVLTVLTVTAASRQVTARYEDFFGLYDLAAAGNEQAFFVIERGFERHREAAYLLARQAYAHGSTQSLFELFRREVLEKLSDELAVYFRREGFEYVHEWGLVLEFPGLPDGHTVYDRFTAGTIVSRRGAEGFYIHTRIAKYADGVPGILATVRSGVNFLDYFTLEMVELLRIAS